MLDIASHTNRPLNRARYQPAIAAMRPPWQSRNKSIAAVISVLLHVLALWLVVRHRPDLPVHQAGHGDTVTTLLMIPDGQNRAKDAMPPQATPSPPGDTVAKPVRRRPVSVASAKTRPTRPPTVPKTPRTIALDRSLPATNPLAPAEAVPEDDFSARLAARQRQRATAETQERDREEARGTTGQQANERGKQVALDNIASQLRSAGLEKDDAGGLFQIQHVGPHHAEFLFRGWKKEARRNWSQQLDIEQGAEIDIRIAVVKKMIDIIRQHTKTEFTWNSYRLGKQIHLSARLEDDGGLQQFLLREFFPDYIAK